MKSCSVAQTEVAAEEETLAEATIGVRRSVGAERESHWALQAHGEVMEEVLIGLHWGGDLIASYANVNKQPV